MAGRKNTKQDMQNRLNKEFGKNEYILLGDYINYDTKHKFKHKCGNVLNVSFGNIFNAAGCSCQHKKHGRKFRSTKEAQNTLDKLFGKNEYKLLDNYKGIENFYKFKHKCGLISKFRWQTLISKNNNSKCSCTHKHNHNRTLASHNEEIKQWRKSKQWECLKFSGNTKDQNTYKHLKCGTVWQTSLISFKNSTGCPKCNGSNNLKVSKKEIQKRIDKLHGENVYKLIGQHSTLQKENTFKHIDCGKKFQCVTGNILRSKNICSHCYTTGIQKIKNVTIDGVEFKFQGFEDKTLKRLLKKYKAEDILTGSVKENRFRIRYDFEGKRDLRYLPDFYIKKDKLIVETKCLTTLGLSDKDTYIFPKSLFYRTQAKAQACINKGYKFRLELYNNTGSKRIKLPKNWMFLPREQLLQQLPN